MSIHVELCAFLSLQSFPVELICFVWFTGSNRSCNAGQSCGWEFAFMFEWFLLLSEKVTHLLVTVILTVKLRQSIHFINLAWLAENKVKCKYCEDIKSNASWKVLWVFCWRVIPTLVENKILYNAMKLNLKQDVKVKAQKTQVTGSWSSCKSQYSKVWYLCNIYFLTVCNMAACPCIIILVRMQGRFILFSCNSCQHKTDFKCHNGFQYWYPIGVQPHFVQDFVIASSILLTNFSSSYKWPLQSITSTLLYNNI